MNVSHTVHTLLRNVATGIAYLERRLNCVIGSTEQVLDSSII